MPMMTNDNYTAIIRELTPNGLKAVLYLARHGGTVPEGYEVDGRFMRSPERLGLVAAVEPGGWRLTYRGRWFARKAQR